MACFWIYKKITDTKGRRVWLSETCIEHGHTNYYTGTLDKYGDAGELEKVDKSHKKHGAYTLIFDNFFSIQN